ncbi:MAG: N-acetyltransferase family protein [Planctomycetota bacterium]
MTEESTPDIVVRGATIDDLGAIFHLGERLFTSEFPNLYRTWDEYEVTGLFHAEREYCLVADAGGMLAGFAIGATVEKERTAWNYGHLTWLGVDPAWHRRGVASLLFDAFVQRLRSAGIRMLMVDTQADNESALRFFRHKGLSNPTGHVYLTMAL